MQANPLRWTKLAWTVVAAGFIFSIPLQGQAPVKLWEEPMVIPTYPVGPAEINPMFYAGRTYQGAKGPMYPYSLTDRLSETKQDKTYKAVWLENQYVKFSILPELGGRIFSGLDKTNNYDFLYRQHVIKPSLIGMVGAWISGGVEWNIPHHHRASTFMPVDYKLEEHPDGSKTLWVGELEWRHRMRWIVGLTLYPGKSYIEATIKLINRTPVAHSMLYFANVAVHVNPQYQVIFPPGTEFGTQHAKREFVHWPIGKESYAGVDYRGVDISWWKNHPNPVSIFAWNYEDDFFGGYDQGKKAGLATYADHHVSPGKKFFEFANGPAGYMWDKILTDTDGPYLELMAGAYSDNQPDYSWVQPYETRVVKQYWYPIRELGGIKNANLDAAVNLEINAQNQARMAFNATSEFRGAKVRLEAGGKTVKETTIDIGPGKPFVHEVALPQGTLPETVRVSLQAADGKELISYQPAKLKNSPMPKPVEPPPLPSDLKTNEELYLAGLRLEQFYNPSREPYPYYEEALKRDPGDVRVNTALGILYWKRGMFAEAEAKFKKALERLTHNYTSPKEGEPFYYLGTALKAQGKLEEALDAFQKAAWSSPWYAQSNLALSEIASRRGEFSSALTFVNRSLAAYGSNPKSLNLKAVLLRKLRREQEALDVTVKAAGLDPLDFWAGKERQLALVQASREGEAREAGRQLGQEMRGAVQSYLELAADYANCGLWEEAISVLDEYVALQPDKGKVYPMVHYSLGFYWLQKGDRGKMLEHYRQAAKMPSDYCFPFRLESIGILESAIQENPADAMAPYYLGNLLYDFQPDRAIAAWEKGQQLDPGFAIAHRNLGLAYWRIRKDATKGIASLEKAVAANNKEPRYYFELDSLYEIGGVAHARRLEMLEKHHETVVQRDDALLREVGLHILTGNYQKALALLSNRHFHLWEGQEDEAFNVHNLYVAALLLQGQQEFKAANYQAALKDFEAALEYPDRFEIGRSQGGGSDLKVQFFIATAYEALGNREKAQSLYTQATQGKEAWTELRYYQGLAFQKLGQTTQAAANFDGLIRYGQQRLTAKSSIDFFAKFGARQTESAQKAQARYLIALGYLGKGQKAQARLELEKALQLDINNWGAQTMLATLR
jgi:tetratricopeptide (TPR) repeat protein